VRRRLVLPARVFLVILACAAVAACGNSSAGKQGETQVTSATTRLNARAKVPKPAQPMSLRALVAKVRSGVVRIDVDACDGQFEGTGFMLGPRLVATVEHVVDGAVVIRLVRSGSKLGTATVIGSDPSRDLALLRTSVPVHGYHFALENRTPALGEDVAALGFPLGLPLSVSRGLVSGSDRTVPIEGIRRRKLVQTDAAVNHGNSGGPLISLDSGKVVGLVDIGSTEANGIAFAVSSQVANPLLRAWSVSPQPIAAARCGLEPQSNPTSQAQTQPPPPPPPSDAQAVEDAITTHWDLIRQQRYSDAYDLFSPRLQAQFSRSGWVADKERDRPKVSAIDFTSDVSIAGDEADVDVGFTTVGKETSSNNNGCNVWNGSYHLVRLHGEWLIDATHLSRVSC
jgi:serine protease Do